MGDDSMSRRVTLVLDDGRSEAVAVAAGESVLAAAERAGLSLPFGCRRGACGTCTARLLDGRCTAESSNSGEEPAVEHARPPAALADDALADGYVLACCARPREDCRLRVGPAVHRELLDDPFR